MDTLLLVSAVILGILGIIGSIVPALPGPPLSWIGMLLIYFRGGLNGAGEAMSTGTLLIWLGITTLVTVLDYIIPGWMTKLTGGSKYAGWGATIGLIAGMLIPPVGIILGALLGAFIAEVIFADKDFWSSASSAIGAFIGFLFGTGLKLIVSGIMLWKIIVFI
jgi:uncharacterized protein